jgi:hypothetical protein
MGSRENRRAERKLLQKPVQVATGFGANVKCVMKDISQTGARLDVASGGSAPDVFLLILGHGLERWCQVVWRADHELGVQFISPPASIAAKRSTFLLDT